MTRFRMICPDCGAVVLSTAPQVLVWELCPSCRSHVWDANDALMAEVCLPDSKVVRNRNVHPDN